MQNIDRLGTWEYGGVAFCRKMEMESTLRGG